MMKQHALLLAIVLVAIANALPRDDPNGDPNGDPNDPDGCFKKTSCETCPPEGITGVHLMA